MKKLSAEFLVIGALLIAAWFLTGCGILGESVDRNFTARTAITADVPNGKYGYNSTKDQKIDYVDRQCPAGEKDAQKCPVVRELHVTSNTPEAAIVGMGEAFKSQMEAFRGFMTDVKEFVGPMIKAAAAAYGVPLPAAPQTTPAPAPVQAPQLVPPLNIQPLQ